MGAGYHVTEVRAVNVRAVDCGGRADAWAETVVQLWVPEEAESGPPMTAGKFLSIVARVTADVPAVPTAEVRVEYGDVGKAAVSYHVEGVEVADGAVVVRLRAPHVTCKARDRALEPPPNKDPACARRQKYRLLRPLERRELLCLTLPATPPLATRTPGPCASAFSYSPPTTRARTRRREGRQGFREGASRVRP